MVAIMPAPTQEIAFLSGGPADGVYVPVDPATEEIPGAMTRSGVFVRATYCRSGRFAAKGRPIFDWVRED